MKNTIIINIDTQYNVKILTFPDGQPHIQLNRDIYNPFDKKEGDFHLNNIEVTVVCTLNDPIKLIYLMQVANAIDHAFGVKTSLHIPYLMGARFDRVMQPGDSLDLEVVANVINNLNFKTVYLYDVHSEIATILIKNSINTNNQLLVEEYKKPDSILICPDAGAVKKVSKYFEWNKNIVDVVYCIKSRDLSNGKITLKVLEPEKCQDKNCVIIDDLCDAGGTFLGIASQIKPKDLTLIVTHGIFSKGFTELEKYFNEIIVSDSYKTWSKENISIIRKL